MFIWTISDVIGVVFWAIVIVCLAIHFLRLAWKHGHCKHDGGVTETRACDAICNKCGANLGFIGNRHQ
jgi:hypothetical protein